MSLLYWVIVQNKLISYLNVNFNNSNSTTRIKKKIHHYTVCDNNSRLISRKKKTRE
jgi:rRNA maturation endonuclease Nob1